MQFALMLAVLAALGSAEWSPAGPVSHAVGRLLIAVGGAAAVVLIALVGSVVTAHRLRADFAGARPLLERFGCLRRFHAGLWLGTVAATLYWLDWAQLVRFNWELKGTFLVDKILILAPIFLPLVLSWAAFYEVDRAVRLGIARVRRTESHSVPISPITPMGAMGSMGRSETASYDEYCTRRQYVGIHVRHYLGLLLVPLLAILAVRDAAELLAPQWLADGHEAWVLTPALGLLLLGLPVLLRYTWRTRPLEPGPLRSRLEALAAKAGFPMRDILVWQTDGMICNAAVAGVLPQLRYVFFTDALLQRLDEPEIEAVFAHEVAHVRQRHLLWRVLAMAAPVGLWLAAQQALPDLYDWAFGSLKTGFLAGGLAAIGSLAFYLFWVFGYYSRMLEHQADLLGCRLLSKLPPGDSLPIFQVALDKLAAANGIRRTARGWQHASIARRIHFLERVWHDPRKEAAFGRWLRWLSILLIAAVSSPVVCKLVLG
jgi:STE24 endopeptidase